MGQRMTDECRETLRGWAGTEEPPRGRWHTGLLRKLSVPLQQRTDGSGAAPSIYSNTNNQQLLRGTASSEGGKHTFSNGILPLLQPANNPAEPGDNNEQLRGSNNHPPALRFNISLINLQI